MMHRVLPVVLAILAIALTGVAAETQGSDSNGVVNVNTATAEQLQLLPRVGPALSQRIIEFREANGPFESTDEMVAVRGIGERSLESLKPYLAVKGETTLSSKVRLPRRPRKQDAE